MVCVSVCGLVCVSVPARARVRVRARVNSTKEERELWQQMRQFARFWPQVRSVRVKCLTHKSYHISRKRK